MLSLFSLTVPHPMDRSTPGFPVSLTISQSLPKFISIELVMPFNRWCQFLDPRSSPGPLRWEHRALALDHQGNPWVLHLCMVPSVWKRAALRHQRYTVERQGGTLRLVLEATVFTLPSLDAYTQGSWPPCCEDPQASLQRGPRGKKLRPPASCEQ